MDSTEMMKGTKILHCKFMTERRSDIGEEAGRGSCKDNVIDIQKKIGGVGTAAKNE
jgi:hypothetical protein